MVRSSFRKISVLILISITLVFTNAVVYATQSMSVANNYNSVIKPGVWVDLNNIDATMGFYYITTNDGKFGSGWTNSAVKLEPEEVIEFQKTGEFSYKIISHIPASVEDGVYCKEILHTDNVILKNNTLRFKDSDYVYTYICEKMEDVKGELRNYFSKNTYTIRPISNSSFVLNKPFSLVKSRRRSLQLVSNGETWFSVKKSANIDFYKDVNTDEYFGVRNGKIVLYGRFPLFDYRANQVLPDDALIVKPTVFENVTPRKGNAYVWGMSNGYLVLCVDNIKTVTYDKLPIIFLAHIADLKDVEYVKTFEFK